MSLVLIYSTNFNGWNIYDDSNPELDISNEHSELLSNLAEYTSELCNEDGELESSNFSLDDQTKINEIIKSHLNTNYFRIEFDRVST